MSYVSAQQSRLLLGDFALSGYVSSVSPEYTVDMLDVTTIADQAKAYIAGQTTGALTFDGFYDVAAHSDLDGWALTNQPLSYAPQGFTLGNEVLLYDVLRAGFSVPTAASDPVKFSVTAQPTGVIGVGSSLHDLGAETSDTNHTSVDSGVTSTVAGFVAHLHITAYSGLDDVTVTIEDSANNSTFATIGTFTTATAIGGERIAASGTVRRYVRAVTDVTGSGSVTHQVGFARL
jgi:hypothetical protein